MRALQKYLEHAPLFVRYLLACGSGALIGLPFPVAVLWPLSFLGLACLFVLIYTSRKGSHAFWCGFFAGLFQYFLVFSAFLVGIFPFDWYSIASPVWQTIAVGLSFVYVSSVFALSGALCALIVWYLKKNSWTDLIVVPSLWVLFEWMGSFLYYVFLYGPGSLFGPHFTLGYVGYVLAHDTVLLQTAYFGGVYILSFVAAFGGILLGHLFLYAHQRKRIVRIIGVTLLFWLCAHAAFSLLESSLSPEGKTITVAAVSRYMPPTEYQSDTFKEARYQELLSLVAPLRDVDLLIFPENTTFLRTLRVYHEQDRQILQKIGKDSSAPVIVDSEDFLQEDGTIKSTIWFDKDGAASAGSKQFLMQFGEYLPTVFRYAVMMFGGEDLVTAVLNERNYTPGTEIPWLTVNSVVVALRVCDEIMSPLLYRTQVQGGAEVLLSISSLSWFHGSPSVYNQMQRVAKVRAVENGRFLVQASNMAPAFVLNERGEKVAETAFGELSVLVREIPSRTHKTPYILFGNWLPLFFILCISFCVFYKKAQKTKIL